MRPSWRTGAVLTSAAAVAVAAACATGGLETTGGDASTADGGGDATSACPQYDLQTDPMHCGSCTNACSGAQVCSSGQCKAQCDPPTLKCLNVDAGGGDAGAGLCIDIQTDPNHCGTCTTECPTGDAGGPESGTEDNPDAGIPTPDGGFPPGPYWSTGSVTCDGGMCGIACPPGMTGCSDSICYDTQNAHDHCGNCTTPCADDTEWCTQGNCCPVGQAYCGGMCVDVLSNDSDCGGCGIVCGGGTPVCSGGTCTSAITFTASFTSGADSTTQCTTWNTFRTKLTGTYSTITMSGTDDTGGVTCTGADANTLCQGLHNGVAVAALSCGGHMWEIGISCGSTSSELSADGTLCACETTGFDVRPCIGNDNWGGVDTATCTAPSQTMTVTCE